MSGLKELMKRIEQTPALIEQALGNSLIVAQQEAFGSVTRRIFNDGLDANGNPIGKYESKSHIKKRKAKGLQTVKKDLQFNGDLFQTINLVSKDDPSVDKDTMVPVVGNKIKNVVMGITNVKTAKIAGYLEEQADDRPIFQASESETKQAIDVMQSYYSEQLQKIINGWTK